MLSWQKISSYQTHLDLIGLLWDFITSIVCLIRRRNVTAADTWHAWGWPAESKLSVKAKRDLWAADVSHISDQTFVSKLGVQVMVSLMLSLMLLHVRFLLIWVFLLSKILNSNKYHNGRRKLWICKSVWIFFIIIWVKVETSGQHLQLYVGVKVHLVHMAQQRAQLFRLHH